MSDQEDKKKQQLNLDDYKNKLNFNDKEKVGKALNLALDTRKFEIDLYWKRATYFWTFIATTFGGYGFLAFKINGSSDNNLWLLLIVSCLGFIFSVAWYLVNRGSKFWQNNWEIQVALLEDEVIGSLYKIIAESATEDKKYLKHFLTAPAAYSVSKINQILSVFISFFWMLLICNNIYLIFLTPSKIGLFEIIILLITFGAFYCLLRYGKSENYKAKIILSENSIEVIVPEKPNSETGN
ncbi:MAG: hypothetical protein RLZ75_1448 [Pseudomonadota bacterium]|jgi:hypothetical protein